MTDDRIKKFVIPNLPYLMLVWFFGKCGEAYRTSPSKDALRKLMDCIGSLGDTMSNPMPSFNPFDLLIGLVGAAAVYSPNTPFKKQSDFLIRLLLT